MAARRPSYASAGFKSDLFTVRETLDKTPKHILVEVKNKRTRSSFTGAETIQASLIDEAAIVQAAQRRILKYSASDSSLRKAMRWLGGMVGVSRAPRDLVLLNAHLAVGSDDAAANYVTLYDAGITHICNVASQCDLHFMGKFIYMHLKIKDSPELDIRSHFDAVFAFMNRARDVRGRVLVHCVAGVSRSVTFVIAYLMKETNLNLQQAYALLKQRRPLMCPNKGFRYQLALYEIDLYGSSSVMRSDDKDWDFYEWNVYKQRLQK
ncbi:hypothetical protein SPRG_02191 [Saprolegnia parasitica CBS 223.65]|uniref:Protein-serine/threonine phosphatase n=1 Tax=Saprolegnia parasitica (strain CBS 223.65) TaxID=695850 RepID=A0A067CRP7_SAPPC|nr:hypothetical protein SPRG_02191 [Saprolegnia parasitica CBS 223.65]KDO33384.1 hypothetical protein SPRG_02191 [Saprolegnia parasitica CBS 223.65]|eukprot:XP_012196132.1 hypothetical protein SPRG_02191 [Saprolegnia parasitica CBS 223.65]